ncbi:SWR1-complex protein [Plectosphaerella cucumerina]|uniref:SWR1-complex protein 4 n=1 Tax=Plectosphaerella cucumerina TaxID=40658 RepID=A0A8K0TPW8_9PEZI|nr:SWR1-complex protein [Plectosphaerella cucumerina]
MASSDLRDVLNLDAHAGPRPNKKQKTSASRQNLKGLAREVQNLGGDNPIAIVPATSVFKKRRNLNRKPAQKWELKSFHNSARHDESSLVLRHWRRKTTEPAAPPPADGEESAPAAEATTQGSDDAGKSQEPAALEDSAFAKFNVHVQVPQYNEEQYRSHLTSADWTKDETDYLMGLVGDFDLRWPLIWDRYDYTPEAINGEASADGDESKAIIPVPKPRSMEDLKARYYAIAAKMMAAQTPVQYMTKEEFSLHETMANFNPGQEKMRKDFAINALSRTKEEANEEESLLVEVKRIMARNVSFNEARHDLYTRLDYPHTDQDMSAFKSSAGLQTLLQNMMTADKNKKRKSLMAADGVSPSQPGQPGSAAGPGIAEGGIARRESIAAAPPGHHRDSISSSVAQTPTTEKATGGGGKKGQQSMERRKLSEAEKYIYGVTYHDRLPPGPTFRYERINKLFTSKSGQQQTRMTNVLAELDVPGRLIMPTAAVTSQFEQLLAAINSLIDARKVTDKVDAEIKLEAAKKAEREEKLKPKESPAPQKADEEANAPPAATEDDKEAANGADDGKDADDTAAPAEPAAEPAADAPTEEATKERRPGSSGAHKRSASVLSTVSDDKGAKRQKK